MPDQAQSTQQDIDTIRTETRATLVRYLQQFPEETVALAALARELKGPNNPFARTNMQGHVTASVAVLSPDASCLLLVHHKFLNLWIPPGGHYEAPGSLWMSAQREVAEETGVSGLRLHGWGSASCIPFDIDTHRMPANPSKGEGDHYHHDFRFLAIAPKTALVLTPQLKEVHAAQWLPLDEVYASADRRLAVLVHKLRSLQGSALVPARTANPRPR